MASNPISKLTEEEYLASERAAEFKSEFLNGEIFAMSGGTMRHARLQGNVYGELCICLRGSSCQPFTSDFRVKVAATGMYTYPDISVVRGKPTNDDILLNPAVIVEVISPVHGEVRSGPEIPKLPDHCVAQRLYPGGSK